MGLIELGVIVSIFGQSQREIAYGGFVESVARGLSPQTGRHRWASGTIAKQYGSKTHVGLSTIIPSRAWPQVSRDHSRTRHGNQRS